ncbi:hypothetical protein ACOMHN_023326 [Nucella lapillus]
MSGPGSVSSVVNYVWAWISILSSELCLDLDHTAVPTPLISTPPSQPHTGPLRLNLRARSPQGATNVRPPRGHLPEEALHICWVPSAVFSGAFL